MVPHGSVRCATPLERRRHELPARGAIAVQTRTVIGREHGGGRHGRWDRRGCRHGAIRTPHDDLPVHALVLHPGGAFDERPQIEPVMTRREGSLDHEAEPRDLTGTDIRRGLSRDAIRARPARVRRSEIPVAAELARSILTGLRSPRAEIRRLARPAGDPAERSGVAERDGRDGLLAGTQRHVSALAVPRRVEARDAGRRRGGRRDTRADGAHAGRGTRADGRGERAGDDEHRDEQRAERVRDHSHA